MNIDEFIATYTTEVAELSRQLRAFVLAQAPESVEQLHVGWRVISYESGSKFCAIAPHANWVNLQFHQGASLGDPDGLLEGTGKSMRHVKIKTVDDLSVSLASLIKEAAAA